jgi:hypothetical protein
MCFDDGDTYTTRTYVADGARYSEEYLRPRYGMSWRRRNGLGGRYYPSRYYSRRPSGRYMMSNALATRDRYLNYDGYPAYRYPQHNSFPRGVVPGGYTGYSSGYGRYCPDNRVAMPHYTALVSLCSFLLLPTVLLSHLPFYKPLPSRHWLAWHLDSSSGL